MGTLDAKAGRGSPTMTTDAKEQDRALLLRIQAGRLNPPVDQAAETEYFTRFSQLHLKWVTRAVHSRWDAEELLQEAALRLIRHIAKYNPQAERSAGAWGSSVLRNFLFTELKRRRGKEACLEEYVDADVRHGPSAIVMQRTNESLVGEYSMRATDPLSLESDESDEAVSLRVSGMMTRLAGMTSKQVRAVLLYCEGKRDPEVAAILGIGTASVRGYRKLGVKILERELAVYRGQRHKQVDGRTRGSTTQEVGL